MKTVKYYYSKAIHVRYLPCVTDDQGEVVGYVSKNFSPARKLPRITIASVYNNEDNTMSFGMAICSPKDTFKKSVGRELAYQRALTDPACTIKDLKPHQIRKASKKYANMMMSEAEESFLNLKD